MTANARLSSRLQSRTRRLGPEQMLAQLSSRRKIPTILACTLIPAFLILAPPLHQSASYHDFADRRAILNIPDFWDVISNLLFLVVGVMGLFRFRDSASRILFLGVFCTAFGSAYYHLAPDSARLFWDRLPMTIAFMSLFAIAIKRPTLVGPLVLVGISSVVWWRITDNLWPYGFVQFGTMAALLVIAIRSEPGLWPVFIFYGLSKISEHFDRQIYSVSPFSGHTIKHFLAGVATLYIYHWIRVSRIQPVLSDADARSSAIPENTIYGCDVRNRTVAE